VELHNVGMAMRVINGSGSVFTIGEKDLEHGALYTIGSTKIRVKGNGLDRKKQKDDASTWQVDSD